MVKHKKKRAHHGFKNPERASYKQKLKLTCIEWREYWDNSSSETPESRWHLSKQSMDAPYKQSNQYEWFEGENTRYSYKKLGNTRKLLNAKAKKPKNKKFYRKARSMNLSIPKPLTLKEYNVFLEREEWWERNLDISGWGYCKACNNLCNFAGYDLSMCETCLNDMREIEKSLQEKALF